MSGPNYVREPLSQRDIIYFVVTDRFRDADRSNNQIQGSPVNNSNLKHYHGGDFAGIMEKIPYLTHLGITALWITPVYLSIGSLTPDEGSLHGYHGYWSLNFEQVDPHLISLDTPATPNPASLDPSGLPNGKARLKALADALHSHNMKLILDMVVNHTGYHTNAYRDSPFRNIPGHWFKPREEWTLFGLPALDHRLADVRDYFVNNIVDWIEETGIDAIRMDTVPHVDPSFWYYFKSYVRGKYRNVFFLGEDLDFDAETVARYQRHHDFDSLFDFPLRRNIIEVLICNEANKIEAERKGMMAIASPRLGASPDGVLDADRKYNNANRLVTLLDNHDLDKRIMSWALTQTVGEPRQAANLVKYCLSFQFTTRGIPQIYYGTELGLEGDSALGGDWELRRDMPWEIIDPDTNEPLSTFPVAKEIYQHLRKLIRIRRENEALHFGYLFTLYSDYFLYAFLREFRGNTVIVVMNNGLEPMGQPVAISIDSNANVPIRIKQNLLSRKTLVNLLNPNDKLEYPPDGNLAVRLEGKEAKLYRLV